MTDSAAVNTFIGADKATSGAMTRLIADVTQDFASSLNIDETLQNAIDRFITYLDAEAASIFLLDDATNLLVCRECVGPVDVMGLTLGPFQGIVGKTVKENAAQIVRDVANDPDFAASVDRDTGFVTRSILCAPLTVRGNCIGALELINKRSGDGLFDARELRITRCADCDAIAIDVDRRAEVFVRREGVPDEGRLEWPARTTPAIEVNRPTVDSRARLVVARCTDGERVVPQGNRPAEEELVLRMRRSDALGEGPSRSAARVQVHAAGVVQFRAVFRRADRDRVFVDRDREAEVVDVFGSGRNELCLLRPVRSVANEHEDRAGRTGTARTRNVAVDGTDDDRVFEDRDGRTEAVETVERSRLESRLDGRDLLRTKRRSERHEECEGGS